MSASALLLLRKIIQLRVVIRRRDFSFPFGFGFPLIIHLQQQPPQFWIAALVYMGSPRQEIISSLSARTLGCNVDGMTVKPCGSLPIVELPTIREDEEMQWSWNSEKIIRPTYLQTVYNLERAMNLRELEKCPQKREKIQRGDMQELSVKSAATTNSERKVKKISAKVLKQFRQAYLARIRGLVPGYKTV